MSGVKTVSLSDIAFDDQEEQAVLEVLRSRWLSTGAVTQSFEQELAEFVGSRHAIAVANGTAALHLAMLAIGMGPGDEVLVPSLTFVATVNAIRYTGATPVFVDIASLEDWNVSVEGLRRAVTPRTRAIVVMHYGGYPCDLTAITALAAEHDLLLVEDAAHGAGSWLAGRHVGTFGKAGCFSFFANKNLVTGEGGMVVTDDADLAQRLRHLRSHGMTTLSWERDRGHAFQYDVVALGYNYRFDELRSAIGRVQLRKLEGSNRRREQAWQAYAGRLTTIDRLSMPFSGSRADSSPLSRHLMPVLLDPDVDRLELMRRLRERGVQSSIHYPPAHLMSIHQDLAPAPLPLTEAVGRRELTLPLHPLLAEEDVDFVVEALRACLQ